jgi:hypothetical protein
MKCCSARPLTRNPKSVSNGNSGQCAGPAGAKLAKSTNAKAWRWFPSGTAATKSPSRVPLQLGLSQAYEVL